MSQVLTPTNPSGSVAGGAVFGTGFTPTPSNPVTGSVECKVTLQKSDSGPLGARIELMQSGRVLASTTVAPSTSATEYTLGVPTSVLTSLPGSCTVNDLSVKVTGIGVESPCCRAEGGAPNLLHLDMSGCPGFEGGIDLIYGGDPLNPTFWYGEWDGCILGLTRIYFYCDGDQWVISLASGLCSGAAWANSYTCDPVDILFGPLPFNPNDCTCCVDGIATLRVYE